MNKALKFLLFLIASNLISFSQSSFKPGNPNHTPQAVNEWYTTCGAANYWDFGTITPTGVQQMVGGNNYDLCCEKMGKGAFVVGAAGSHYCFELNITGSGLPYGQGCEIEILDGACGTATQNIIADFWMTTNASGTSVTGGTANGTTGPGNQITECACWTASATDVGKTYYLQLSEGPGGGQFFGAAGFCTVYLYYRTGDYTCSGGSIILPIELESFKATAGINGTKLEWATASEKNNDYFTLERSDNAKDFTPLKKIKGAGNSAVRKEYSVVDENPLQNVSYYRLKQTDYNGEFKYSEIVSSATMPFTGNLHPNPTVNEVNFSFYSPAKATAEIQLLDIAGRVVTTMTREVSEGDQVINAGLESLAKGVYYFRISIAEMNYSYSAKLIKN